MAAGPLARTSSLRRRKLSKLSWTIRSLHLNLYFVVWRPVHAGVAWRRRLKCAKRRGSSADSVKVRTLRRSKSGSGVSKMYSALSGTAQKPRSVIYARERSPQTVGRATSCGFHGCGAFRTPAHPLPQRWACVDARHGAQEQTQRRYLGNACGLQPRTTKYRFRCRGLIIRESFDAYRSIASSS